MLLGEDVDRHDGVVGSHAVVTVVELGLLDELLVA